MKKLSAKLILSLFTISAGLSARATTRTVNNTTLPVNPGQYSTVGAAIGASSAGDTIIVAGSASPYDYSAITLDRPLVLLGAGYNPQGANRYATKTLQGFQFTCGASGSTIMGFEFDNLVFTIAGGGTTYNNITFARNYFNYNNNIALNFTNSDSCNNINIINNIFGNRSTIDINPPWFNHSFIYNNVFLSDGSNTTAFIFIYNSSYSTLIVDHNLFLCGSNSIPLLTGFALNNSFGFIEPTFVCLLSNNIFYNCTPYYFDFTAPLCYNNISYAGDIVHTMTGSGNLNNTDPMLASIFNNPTLLFDFNSDNIGLKSGSPAINAGSDGTNMGPTGGLYPVYNTNLNYLTGEPPVPEVTQITVTGSTTVTPGGTVNVTVKAIKIN